MQQPDNSETIVEELLIDSRKLSLPDTSVFFAIDGLHRSGISFINELYTKGVRMFVVGNEFDNRMLDAFPSAGFIKVIDTIESLQQLTATHRSSFKYPVIGITGSNGKTIIKEWLFQLLHTHYTIVRSPKSYNSQIGVPLSIWQMNGFQDLAIFEAGISQRGEMEKLHKIINPDIGILTHMGEAHAEGFRGMQDKISEKLKLFSNVSVLIFCNDDLVVRSCIENFHKNHSGMQLLRWGHDESADLFIRQVIKKEKSSCIDFRYQSKEYNLTIPFFDEASIFNVMTVVLAASHLGIGMEEIITGVGLLRPLEMRLELKPGIHQSTIINDSYSSDIDSLNIALDFLFQQQTHERKTLVLSDIQQADQADEPLYKKLAFMLKSRNIGRFIGVGPRLNAHKNLFADLKETVFFMDTKSLSHAVFNLGFHQETILLKGARSFGFEKVSRMLEQKLHDTVLEVNLNALRDNLRSYRRLLHPGTGIMVMVKAFGYGSGSADIASLLQREGVDMLAVAYADEGVELRSAGIKLPVMVMNVSPVGFDNLIRHQLEPEIYSINVLSAFTEYLKENQIFGYPIHIKLDTGMHRLGFMKNEMNDLKKLLSDHHEYINVHSVFTHLVASEDPSQDSFTNQQAADFKAMADELQEILGKHFFRHVCNSGAIERHPSLHLDMVRLGIGLYGAGGLSVLRPIATLKSTIAQIKHLKAGDTVGYGRAGMINKDSIVATVRIGYADGYPRTLGNGKGLMMVAGSLVPVLGNVCMDMTMIDITGVSANEGDEVIVFGESPSVKELAQWAGTIPYEILTNISQRVKRVYFEE
jgi:alanine racemase